MTKEEPFLYGLLGFPVKHSFSPAMHNAAFAALRINARYELFEIPSDGVDDFFDRISAKNIKGLNITVPYKETALKYTTWQSPLVRFTGAANVIINKGPDGLAAWNTDGLGFHRHLTKSLGFDIRGKKAVILGAGGAAKAVTYQLLEHRAKILYIYDVDNQKSLKLGNNLAGRFGKSRVVCADSIEELNIKSADLVINATPVGLKPDDPLIVRADEFISGQLVYDLIYNPPQTKLLEAAESKGAEISNGLGMLFYQGVKSLELWLDLPAGKAPEKEMRQALQETLNKARQ